MLSPHIQSASGCVLTHRQRNKSKVGKEGYWLTVGGESGGVGGWARKKRKGEQRDGKKTPEKQEAERWCYLRGIMLVLAFSKQSATQGHVATGLAVFAYKLVNMIQGYVGLLQELCVIISSSQTFKWQHGRLFVHPLLTWARSCTHSEIIQAKCVTALQIF